MSRHDDDADRLVLAGERMAGSLLIVQAEEIIRNEQSLFHSEEWAGYEGCPFHPSDLPSRRRADMVLHGYRVGLEMVKRHPVRLAISPYTVAWAMVLSDGGAITPERARESLRWFTRVADRYGSPPGSVPSQQGALRLWERGFGEDLADAIEWCLMGDVPGWIWVTDLVEDMDFYDDEGLTGP